MNIAANPPIFQFFVNTTTDPPRSIWHHPYDDPQFLSTVSSSERSRIQGLHKVPTAADIEAESSDDDDQHASPQDHAGQDAPTGVHKFGRKMKDKLTSSTHVEREQKRRQREEEERQIYERHQMYRRAMSKAAQTGEPQCIGRDRSGKEVYIEPPMGLGAGFGGGRGYSGNAYGYNPYTQGGYAHPNSRYIRPQGPYRRPYGGGYGGGYGMGLGMPLMLGGGLGLGGAMMLGGMGGGFGGGMDGGMGGGFGGGGMDGGGGGGMC